MSGHTYAVTDGTTTFTLTSTNSAVVAPGYMPSTGDGVTDSTTDTIPLLLYATTAALLQTAVATLQQLLNTARRRKLTGVGPQLYLTVQLTSDASAWRSRIIDARLDLKEDSLNVFGQAKMGATLYLERVPYFEGAEVELELSANGQAAATGGRTIYNNPANGNWVQIAAAQATGNLPAPVKLTLQNTTGSAQIYYRLFMSVNAYSDPANLVHYLQAEAASGVTPVTCATCSGGQNIDISTVSGLTRVWTLPTADLQRTKGRRGRILARIDGVGPVYVTPQIRDAAGTAVLWSGDEMNIGPAGGQTISYQDCGVVPLPPGGYGASWGALTLALVFRGAVVASLDVLQLTMLDSYRYLEIAATSVAANAYIVHDGIDELSYVINGAVWYPLASAFGGALTLQPNTLQRIHVLHTLSAAVDDAPIANTFSVRAYYRPRRATV
ncbi:MAG: hypothetical protein IPM06_19725 [Rhizobiales bacterium]|nr:hypothetical protein [Hyphomicrobiales bacterium]